MKTMEIITQIVIPLATAILSVLFASISLVISRRKKKKAEKSQIPVAIEVSYPLHTSQKNSAYYVKRNGTRLKGTVQRSVSAGLVSRSKNRYAAIKVKRYAQITNEMVAKIRGVTADPETLEEIQRHVIYAKESMKVPVSYRGETEAIGNAKGKDTVQ